MLVLTRECGLVWRLRVGNAEHAVALASELFECFATAEARGCVEIQRIDAIRLYRPQVVWRDVGQRLLDDGCRIQTGRHEEDGCWPDFIQR